MTLQGNVEAFNGPIGVTTAAAVFTDTTLNETFGKGEILTAEIIIDTGGSIGDTIIAFYQTSNDNVNWFPALGGTPIFQVQVVYGAMPAYPGSAVATTLGSAAFVPGTYGRFAIYAGSKSGFTGRLIVNYRTYG